jgi:transcription initiation factor TFIIH subunit 1
MAPTIRASVLYKKQDGTLSITKDKQLVLWTPATPLGSAPTLKISVSDVASKSYIALSHHSALRLARGSDNAIPDLQKSPATSAKVSVKIIVQLPNSSSPENYVFAFTSSTAARAQQESVVEVLRDVIAARKAGGGTGVSTPSNLQAAQASPVPSSSSAAVVAAATPMSKVPSAVGQDAARDLASDSALLSDIALQKSLLSQNPLLRQRFEESLKKIKTMPDAMPLGQFSSQFWSTRTHLLRAHAVEKGQSQGAYNVLSEVKPKRNNEGVIKLNLSKEQIQLIFNQHPLVRRVYNDLVPNRLTEAEFWSKFFVSKLFKKLKGERITELDGNTPELDKYLAYDEDDEVGGRQFQPAHIPRFLDMEGNEQDHSQARGNAPHSMMRPNTRDRVPILRALNAMSEKMMANVAPYDTGSLHAPSGMDETAYEELRLRDLQATEDDRRIVLSVSSGQKFFSQDASLQTADEAAADPMRVIADLGREISASSGFALQLEMDDGAKRQATSTSNAMMRSVKQRLGVQGTPTEAQSGLSKSILDSAAMTHNTTIEFLHYFWTVYLSGDESRAGELAKLVETLDKSLARIKAVAADAESERSQRLEQLRLKHEEYAKRTGKRIRFNASQVGGGGELLKSMMASTQSAVRFAEGQYQKTYSEQVAQQDNNTTLGVG